MDLDENCPMRIARKAVVISGIALPLFAGLVSMGLAIMDGEGSIGTMLTIMLVGSMANGVCWGSVLLATLAYRNPRSVFFPAVAGIVPLTLLYATLGSSAREPFLVIGLVIAPFYTIPLVLLGAMVGRWFDKRSRSVASDAE